MDPVQELPAQKELHYENNCSTIHVPSRRDAGLFGSGISVLTVARPARAGLIAYGGLGYFSS